MLHQSKFVRSGIVLGFWVGSAAWGAPARAYTCGYSQDNAWNVPNGTVVRSEAPGPIDAVMNAIGESATHIAMAHGSYIMHNSRGDAIAPGLVPNPALPLDGAELANGRPGFERVNVAGYESYLFGGSNPIWWAHYQRGDGETNADGHKRGTSVTAPYTGSSSALGVTTSYCYPGMPDCTSFMRNYDAFQAGKETQYIEYNLAHFMNLQDTNRGSWAWASRHGAACSTTVAYLAELFDQGTNSIGGDGPIEYYAYTHAKTVAAIDGVSAKLYNDCLAETGWFLNTFASVLTNAICANARDQVMNGFTGNSTTSADEALWNATRNDPASQSKTISPDRIGGWAPHPYGHNTQGPWTWDGEHSITFNGPVTLGCW